MFTEVDLHVLSARLLKRLRSPASLGVSINYVVKICQIVRTIYPPCSWIRFHYWVRFDSSRELNTDNIKDKFPIIIANFKTRRDGYSKSAWFHVPIGMCTPSSLPRVTMHSGEWTYCLSRRPRSTASSPGIIQRGDNKAIVPKWGYFYFSGGTASSLNALSKSRMRVSECIYCPDRPIRSFESDS